MATPVAKQSKMDLAKKIYDRVTAKAAPKGKSHRGIFTEIVVEELGMSTSGANTYFQNLKSEAEGKGRYPYSPASKAIAAGETPRRPGRPSLKMSKSELETELEHLKQMAADLNKTINRVSRTIAA